MRILTIPWAAIQHEVAYTIAPGVFRLCNYRLAVHDQETDNALVVETEREYKEKEK
jgi:hypothetical protein